MPITTARVAVVAYLLAAGGCGGGGSGGGSGGGAPAPTFAVSVDVEGLHALEHLDLRLNGGATLSLTGSTSGTFTNQLARGATYTVSVVDNSDTALCKVLAPTGVIADNIALQATCDDGEPHPFRQVADVNSVALNNDSLPQDFIQFGGQVAFAALVGTEAARMFLTDGTPQGTEQATPDTLDFQAGLLELGGRILFVVRTSTGSYEPWSSDGTQSGATRLAEVVPWPYTRVGQLAFFFATDPIDAGTEPWVTDGTPAGTHLVRDLVPGGPSSGEPGQVIYELNGKAVFRAHDGTAFRLWSSDGSDAGTVAISQPTTILEILGVHNGRLYYLRPEANGQNSEIWSTDGFAGGESLFMNVAPNFVDLIESFKSVAGSLYFSTNIPTQRVWASDGTAANTRVVFNGPGCGFTALNGAVYFGSDTSIWRTTGTLASTVETIVDTTVNPSGGCTLFAAGNRLIFPRTTVAEGRELWTSDGASVQLLADINPGAGSSLNSFFGPIYAVIGNRAFFGVSDGETGIEPWVTDGTPAGTHQVANVRPEVETLDGALGLLDDTSAGVFFNGCKAQNDCGLWVTDGTESGTREVVGINSPSTGMAFDDRLVFGTLNGLWVSDGTSVGTSQIASATPLKFFDNVDHLLFADFGGPSRTDGTTAGTFQLSNGPANITGFAKFRGYVYFNGTDFASGMPGLYRTDGTTAGTTRVVTADIANPSSQVFATTDDWLIFSAFDAAHGREVWRSDGTAAGTQMIADMFPGTEGGTPGAFARFGSEVYFGARTADSDFGVWATDGTSVRLVRRVTAFGPIEMQATPNALYFTGDDSIYISDGTSAGTRALTARPNRTYHTAELLTATPLGLFFIANDGQLNGRPYSTDGTVALRLAGDVLIGNTSRPIGVANGPGAGVYVIGGDGVTGEEVWLQRR